MNNITSISSNYDEYILNRFYFENNQFDEIISFSDINFITIQKLKDIKENISNYDDILFVHSIIINTGEHYICYYKCNNNWYYYNDLINQSRFIGNINNITRIINRYDEVILLYLNSNEQNDGMDIIFVMQSQKIETNIDKLKNIIENHFNKLADLKILLTH